ncbi:MAG: divergent polysaccharide deacetylase family protein [Desulfuromonas sp.]|nr:divergent polysaccharide deacetylase family protein [Desulfuromonas sp.]
MMLNWPKQAIRQDIKSEPATVRQPLPPRPQQQQQQVLVIEHLQPKRPHIAIIMDDLGLSKPMAQQALAIDLPFTLSIIPARNYSQLVMQLAHQQQREILIHIPMEPISYPRNNPGPLGLFSHNSTEEIAKTMRIMIEQLPYATGGNNHMGSAFTQHADKMEPVLLEMKKNGLFFIDSLTSSKSVAYAEAQRLGVPSAVRDVFLDNVREVEKISEQLQRLVDIAHRNGSAIGICHPYPQTITALQLFSGQLEALEIDIVPVAQLVQPAPQ